MTTVRYELENGKIVNTLKEAKESGMNYKIIYKEEFYGKLNESEDESK